MILQAPREQVDAILGAMAAVALADGVLDAVKVDLVEGYAAALELQEDYVRVLTEAARYATLGELPDGTFGRAFFEHFRRNGFAFPGDPAGLSEGFTTPHDSSHVTLAARPRRPARSACRRSSGRWTRTTR